MERKILPSQFTQFQSEVLIGGLLGDIYANSNGKNTAYFRILRQTSDRAYLEWQYSIFKDFVNSEIADNSYLDKRTNKIYYSSSFKTKSIPYLYPIYQEWYPNGLKIVPNSIKLTPTIVAIWCADDGCFKHIGQSELSLILSTDGFVYEEVKYLASLLQSTLSEKFRVQKHAISKKGIQQYTIAASSNATCALIKYIDPIFRQIKMDRKIVWNDINLNVPAIYNKYIYRNWRIIAPILLKLEQFYSTSPELLEVYADWKVISGTLKNMSEKQFLNRTFDGVKYIYTKTNKGTELFTNLATLTK